MSLRKTISITTLSLILSSTKIILKTFRFKASSLLGRFVNDRNISGISVTNAGEIGFREVTSLAFSILQCTETRITRTIYLSCPTCGRTKFNLQESVRKVKEATSHFKGLKIAVMGCVVNGPGEMAGADYGYVGAAPGKVHIYKGTIPVLKNISEKDAVKELLKVIEEDRKCLSQNPSSRGEELDKKCS